jgi:hypothetical protein
MASKTPQETFFQGTIENMLRSKDAPLVLLMFYIIFKHFCSFSILRKLFPMLLITGIIASSTLFTQINFFMNFMRIQFFRVINATEHSLSRDLFEHFEKSLAIFSELLLRVLVKDIDLFVFLSEWMFQLLSIA